jgi:hypothetical protein
MPFYSIQLLADSRAAVSVETGAVAVGDDARQVRRSTEKASETACFFDRFEADRPAGPN